MKCPVKRGGLRFFLVLAALTHTILAPGYSTTSTILYGTPLILLGLALHFWSKGCLRQNQTVTRVGPYRFVRHPFYLANALIDAGIAVMSGWWVLQALLPIWWLAVYLRVIRAEERHLASLYPDVYPAYQRRVPMMIPYRRPIPGDGPGFSWHNRNIASGREISRALRLFSYPFLFFAVSEARAHRWDFFTAERSLHLVALVALLVLYALAWMFKQHLKLRRLIIPRPLSRNLVRYLAALGILAVAASLRHLETEADLVNMTVGGGLIISSIIAYLAFRQPKATLVGEGIALVGAAVMCELPWLAAAPLLYYGAAVMDQRILATSNGVWVRPALPALTRPTFYHLVLLASIALPIVKELVIDRLT